MSIHVLATYRGGVIEPEHPLDLPDDTRLDIVVVPVSETAGEARDQEPSSLPNSSRISPEDLRARIAQHAVSAGSLPYDFSRADIYRDHD